MPVRWRSALIVVGLILVLLLLWQLGPYAYVWFVLFNSWRFQ